MQAVTAASETARVEDLLARLDPEPRTPCGVPGCVHRGEPSAHAGSEALAA